jgi:hypothetical protein
MYPKHEEASAEALQRHSRDLIVRPYLFNTFPVCSKVLDLRHAVQTERSIEGAAASMTEESASRGPQTQAYFGTQSSQLDASLRYSFLETGTQDTTAGFSDFTQVNIQILLSFSKT